MKKKLFFTLSLALVLLAACGPALGPGSSGFPTGKFVTADGRYVLYNADGTWAFYTGAQLPSVEGTYSVKGEVFTEESNTDTRPSCQEPASYKWSYDGKVLSFSPVGEDSCKVRSESFGDTYLGPQ